MRIESPYPETPHPRFWYWFSIRIPTSAFRDTHMPDFTYEAILGTGGRSTGTLTAASEREVASMLDARGLFPVKISAAGTGTDWPVPYQDLQARGRQSSAIYSTGGGLNSHSAAKGTYGW